MKNSLGFEGKDFLTEDDATYILRAFPNIYLNMFVRPDHAFILPNSQYFHGVSVNIISLRFKFDQEAKRLQEFLYMIPAMHTKRITK
jgi:hypothetical protein